MADLDWEAFKRAVVEAGKDTEAEKKAIKETSLADDIYALVRSISKGVFSGFDDKAVAYGRSKLFGVDYETELAKQLAETGQIKEASPNAFMAGEITGAIAGPGKLGVKQVMALPKLGPMGGRLPHAAGLGGAAGAVYGAGEAPSGEEATGAAKGGATGAILGPVAVGGLQLTGLAANKLWQAANKTKFAQKDFATRKLAQALDRDGMSVDDATNRLTELGPEGVVADIGPNVRGLAESVAQVPGKPAAAAQRSLTARQENRNARLDDAIFKATGGKEDLSGEVKALMTAREEAAAPLYKKAYEVGPVYSDRISEFLKDPLIQKGLKDGIEIERLAALAKGEKFKPGDIGVTSFNSAGDPILGSTPTMQTLDTIKKGLDDILETYREPITGKLKLDKRGTEINNVRKSFIKAIDDLNPDYAAARKAWAGPTATLDAYAKGRDALSQPHKVVKELAKGLENDSEREFFRKGFAEALIAKVHDTGDTASIIQKLFANEGIRDKIKAAFGDSDVYAQFEKAMDAERTFYETYRQVLQNSRTAARTAGKEDLGVDPSPIFGMLSEAAKGNAENVLARGASAIKNWMSRPNEMQREALGPMLFDPAKRVETLNDLRRRQVFNAMRPKNQITGLSGFGAGAYSGKKASDQ